MIFHSLWGGNVCLYQDIVDEVTSQRVEWITQGERRETTAVNSFEQEIYRNYNGNDLVVSCEGKGNRTHYSDFRNGNSKQQFTARHWL